MAKVSINKPAPEAETRPANPNQVIVTDATGRKLTVKRVTVLDRMKLIRIVGPEVATNGLYMSHAALAFSVVAVDDEPRAQPSSILALEGFVQLLGDEGMEAAARAHEQHFNIIGSDTVEDAKN